MTLTEIVKFLVLSRPIQRPAVELRKELWAKALEEVKRGKAERIDVRGQIERASTK